MKNIRVILCLIFFIAVSFMAAAETPYSFNECKVHNGRIENFCEDGAVLLEIVNTSAKVIKAFEVVLILCDQNGDSPFEDGDSVVSYCEERLESGEIFKMALSLDEFVTGDYDGNLYLKNAYLQKVVFADGSSWKDFYGIYGTGDEIQ